MAKLLKIGIPLLALAILSYGLIGTGAWFNDQAAITDNIISSGNLDLAISDVIPSTPMMKSGGDYVEILRFCAVNQGSTNLKWRGQFTDLQAPAGLMDQILISVIINPTSTFSGNYGPATTVWFMDVPIQELANPNSYLLLDPGTNPEPFKPADKACYAILARLGSTATNTYQQDVFTTTLRLNATQWISTDPDWIE
jgi:predicted ribosomally synthesized peptide with SipW-like signal peptide